MTEDDVERVARAIAETVEESDDIDIHEALVSGFDWIDDAQADRMIEAAARAAITALQPMLDKARAEGREAGIKEAMDCQPSTAENPRASAFERGRFDGVMEYRDAIRDLLYVEIPRISKEG